MRALRPMITAMYITKNEEVFFRYSVRSIYDCVDEIVVVDGGSTDATPEIARSMKKVRLYFCGSPDYSVNRNLAVAHSHGDWLMPIDADMVFYSDLARKIPVLTSDNGVDAYVCWFYHLMRDFWHMQNATDCDPFYRWKFLVRRVPGLRWEGAVHENLVGHGPRVVQTDIHMVHYGYVKPQREVFKRWVKYWRLEGLPFREEDWNPDTILDDRPVVPFRHDHPEAIRGFVRSVAGTSPWLP